MEIRILILLFGAIITNIFVLSASIMGYVQSHPLLSGTLSFLNFFGTFLVTFLIPLGVTLLFFIKFLRKISN